MKLHVPHNFTKTEAKTRIDQMGQEYQMVISWTDEFSGSGRMTYNGSTVDGHVEVTDSEVRLDVKLPRLARMFESRIKPQLTAEIEKALS